MKESKKQLIYYDSETFQQIASINWISWLVSLIFYWGTFNFWQFLIHFFVGIIWAVPLAEYGEKKIYGSILKKFSAFKKSSELGMYFIDKKNTNKVKTRIAILYAAQIMLSVIAGKYFLEFLIK